jgi:hypothetical protein
LISQKLIDGLQQLKEISEGDLNIIINDQNLNSRENFYEIEMVLVEDFTKIDKGIVDNTNLDNIYQEIEKYIKTPYTKWLFKEKAKIRFNFAE